MAALAAVVRGWHDDASFGDDLVAHGTSRLPCLWRLPSVLVAAADLKRMGMVAGQPCRAEVGAWAYAGRAWPSDALSAGTVVLPRWMRPGGRPSRTRARLVPVLLEPVSAAAGSRPPFELRPAADGAATLSGLVVAAVAAAGPACDVASGPAVAVPGCLALSGDPLAAAEVGATAPGGRDEVPVRGWVVVQRVTTSGGRDEAARAHAPGPGAVAGSPLSAADAKRALAAARGIVAPPSAAAVASWCCASALVGAAARLGGLPVLWLSASGCVRPHAGGSASAVEAAFRQAASHGDSATRSGLAVLALRAGDVPGLSRRLRGAGAGRADAGGLFAERIAAAVQRCAAAWPTVRVCVVTEEPAAAEGGSRAERLQRAASLASLDPLPGREGAVTQGGVSPGPEGRTASRGRELDGAALDGIVGQDEAKSALRDAVWLAASGVGSGGAAPRSTGVLLFGPPGCSKTMLARAVASAAGLAFFVATPSSLLGRFVGDAERAVASLFARARRAAPSIVFLDEVDAVAPCRSADDGGTSSRKRLLNQLLQEMQGVHAASAPVVVIGATNRPDNVDPALCRAGRLDQQVFVAPPEPGAGAEIVARGLSRLGPSPALTARIAELALEKQGACSAAGTALSGADFAAIARLAAHAAAAEAVSSGSATATLREGHVEAAFRLAQPSLTAASVDFYARYRAEGAAADA